MTNLIAATPLDQVAMGAPSATQQGVYAGAVLFQGAMVCALTASGYLVRAGTASTGPVQGIAEATADNTAGASGDISANLLQGAFYRPNHGTHTVTDAYFGKPVYASDDNTISTTASDGPIAGICLGVDSVMGVLVYISASINNSLWVGSSAAAFTSNKLVSDALAEIYQNIQSSTVAVSMGLMAAILAAGTPMAAFADNAGASAPGVTLANSKAVGIRWNNFATQTAVFSHFVMPSDVDTSANATIKVVASKVGATLADATTFDVAIYPNTVGALHDASASIGGTTGAMTGNAATKTVQEVSLTVTAANLPAAGTPVTVSIKPTDGTLGTDDVIVHSLRLVYKRKVLTS